MALITIRFYTLLQRSLGADSLQRDAENLEEVIEYLEQRFGSSLNKKLNLSGGMQRNCLFLLNGINIRNLKHTRLSEGDILHVFLPVAGG
jgi:molybdopterin converting factor small subunit